MSSAPCFCSKLRTQRGRQIKQETFKPHGYLYFPTLSKYILSLTECPWFALLCRQSHPQYSNKHRYMTAHGNFPRTNWNKRCKKMPNTGGPFRLALETVVKMSEVWQYLRQEREYSQMATYNICNIIVFL